MKPQWRFPPSQRGRKAKCCTEVVAIWSFCVPLGLFFLSNANTVLWLSVRNLSIFRWCLSGWVSGPSPFSPHLSPVCWLAAESFLLAAEATILWRHGWRFTFLLRSSAERRFHTRRAGGHARAVMRSSAGVAYTYPARRRAAALQLQALPADFAQTYSTKRRAIESGKGSTRRLLFFARREILNMSSRKGLFCFGHVAGRTSLQGKLPLEMSRQSKVCYSPLHYFYFLCCFASEVQEHEDWRQVQQFHERDPEFFVYLPSDIKVCIHCVNHHYTKKLHLTAEKPCEKEVCIMLTEIEIVCFWRKLAVQVTTKVSIAFHWIKYEADKQLVDWCQMDNVFVFVLLF